MPAEILLAALVLGVIILVAADFLRTTSDSPHEHAGLPGQPTRISPPADGRQHLDTGAAIPRPGSHGAQKNWPVRTRLSLLAVVSATAAALVTAGAIRAAGAFGGASFHSNVGSIRDGAIVSGVVACIVSAAVLAAGVASAIVLIRSVLRPLRTLQAGAVQLAEVRLPDALRHIARSGGEGGPVRVEAIAVSSSDEIGEVARAFDQMQREVLRLAAIEAGLRGNLNEMFADLSGRSQSLAERQIRLIDELEQGEQDTERLANLSKMEHIAARMRRYSQNLLVLAGHDLPRGGDQPVTLVNVIRAAVSEIEEYERVSLSVQPGIAVSGPAVSDAVYLIAELAENATSLSAPDTPVDVSGRALASGGVLVEVGDQGVGMNPDEIAQANSRLDNPPATDIAVWRNMGLSVVGRLAARHGIKVRLQPSKSGGLTAQVWLPDAIVLLPDTSASPGGGGFEGIRSRRGAHEGMAPGLPAGTVPDRVLAVGAASARSLRPGPAPQDARVRQQPAPAPVLEAGQRPDERRLPIYDAVESDWFGNRREPVGTAATGGSWASPADQGWQAAKRVIAPSSGGATRAGLPVRVPRANLVPGAIGTAQPVAPARAASATAARDRLAGLQRGARQGRAAANAAGNPGVEDQTS